MIHDLHFYQENCTTTISDGDEFEVIELKVVENGYFFRSDILIKLKSPLAHTDIQAQFDGQISSILVSIGQKIKIGKILLKVQKAESISNFINLAFEYNKTKLNDTSAIIILDDISNTKFTSFIKVAGNKTQYLFLRSETNSLGLTFENSNGFHNLKILSQSSDPYLKKGDSIILLFENEKEINYRFQFNAQGREYDYCNILPLTSDDLKVFALFDLKKIILISERIGLYETLELEEVSSNSQFKSEKEAQYLLKYMVAVFLKTYLENMRKIN